MKNISPSSGSILNVAAKFVTFFVNLVCLQGNIFKKSLILKIEFRAVFIRKWKEDSKHRPCYLYFFFLRRSELF